ncbi:cardiotrophin-1-like isoform X2 [Hyperolius riggenbachi]|uniref:cardiotrophin-1-like isoform X2 n=1 Tax=Hyperolius riggenbachi TaxID=752182 RepID=UPI0035A2A862
MEIITVENLPALRALPLEADDARREKQQALLLVGLAKTEAESLLSEYLKHQGPPFSTNFNPPQTPPHSIPVLKREDLPSSIYKRLALIQSSFQLLTRWFASVHTWQSSLNPNAHNLANLLQMSKRNSDALSKQLNVILDQEDLSSPSPPSITSAYNQKVAGYFVCKSYLDWLDQAQIDLTILVSESAV